MSFLLSQEFMRAYPLTAGSMQRNGDVQGLSHLEYSYAAPALTHREAAFPALFERSIKVVL